MVGWVPTRTANPYEVVPYYLFHVHDGFVDALGLGGYGCPEQR